MADIEDILRDAEFLLKTEENKELLKTGQVKLEDVEQMAPETPLRDFLTEAIADPTSYLPGAGAGAFFAKRAGKPLLKTILSFTDPTLGIGGTIKDILSRRWAPGAMGKAADVARDVMQRAKYSQKFGAVAKKAPKVNVPPGRWLEGSTAQQMPASPFSAEELGVKLLTEGQPRGSFNLPSKMPLETTYGPFGNIQPPAVSGSTSLTDEIADITNTFARQPEPIEELTGSLIKMMNRNKLLKEAEKLLGGLR